MGAASPERGGLVRLAATVRAEIAAVERVLAALRQTLAAHPEAEPEIAVVHGTGGLVHDCYTGIEKALRAISPALNGVDPRGEAWHRDLLRAATLDLPGVRPPVLREVNAERLHEYLAFRHVYRNLYAFSLRWVRIRELALGADALWPAVRADLEPFLAFLDAAVDDGAIRRHAGKTGRCT